MNCAAIREKLGGYLDGAVRPSDRVRVQEHLAVCAGCREDLERFRKLSLLLARTPQAVPPADLALRVRLAAASARASRSRVRAWTSHLGVRLENAFRPLALPATGGFFSAAAVFVLVLQLIAPGITVRAVQNDVPISLMRPAELVSLSEYPLALSDEGSEQNLALPHGLMVDVTVDEHGQMANYQILSGPDNISLRHELDQLLLFSRFRPMMSFGRPTSGGHVLLSFSQVRVRG